MPRPLTLALGLAFALAGAGVMGADEEAGPNLRLAQELHARTAALVGAPVPATVPAVPSGPDSEGKRALQLMAEHLRRREGAKALALPAVELALAGQLGASPPPKLAPILTQSLDHLYADLMAGSAACCNCAASASCNDGQFCNGSEICGALGVCGPGAAPCTDANPCTADTCSEGTDQCSFPAVPPPGPVASLHLGRVMPSSPVASLSWSAVSGAAAYNVYRGQAPNLAGLGCFQSAVAGTSTNDDGTVAGSGIHVFLVSAEACGESGLGHGTSGPRPPPAIPCP